MLHSLIANFKELKRKRASSNYFFVHQLNCPGSYYSKHCFDYYKCIFIHVPKTAGISISRALFGHYTDHVNIEWYLKQYHRNTLEKYFKFAFVRNPWDRLYSAYTFLKKGGMYSEDKEFYNENLSHLQSFEEFVFEWLNEARLHAIAHFIPQFEFVTHSRSPNEIRLDFIGKFESLESDFDTVCRRLNLKKRELQKTNASEASKKYIQVYSKDMIDKVAKLYDKDIRLFKYSFDNK